jgi:phosphoribosylaminoimidazole carboxylase PurE protein
MSEQTPPAPAEPLTETQIADLDELAEGAPRVGIIMGSKSDMETMEKAGAVLDEAGVIHEIRVMSAHRDPEMVAEYCKNARMRGLKIIIAGAGISAALPGVAAAHTDLPVIGVPLSGSMTAAGGLDAILSVVQMPPGVPVAPSASTTRRTPRTCAPHPERVSLRVDLAARRAATRARSPSSGDHVSEWALIRARVRVEVEWLLVLAPQLDAAARAYEASRRGRRGGQDDRARTNHDVKAVEYFLRDRVPGGRARAGPLRPDLRGRQQPRVRAHAARRDRRRVAPGGRGAGRGRRGARRVGAGGAAPLPHPRPAGHPDDVRQGDGGLRRALAPPARAARPAGVPRQAQRCRRHVRGAGRRAGRRSSGRTSRGGSSRRSA